MPVLKHHSIVGCRAAGLCLCSDASLKHQSTVGWRAEGLCVLMLVLKYHSIVGWRAGGIYVCGPVPVVQRHSIVGWCLCRWSGASSASVHGFSVLQVSSEGLGLQVERVGVLRQLRYLLRCNLLQNTTMIMINVFTERKTLVRRNVSERMSEYARSEHTTVD